MFKIKLNARESIGVVACFFLIFFSNLEIGALPVYLIKTALFIPVIIFLYNSRTKLFFKLPVLCSVFLLALPSLYIPLKINIIIYLIAVILAGSVYFIYEFKSVLWLNDKKFSTFILAVCMLGFISLLNITNNYVYMEKMLNRYVLLFAIGLLLGICFYFIKNKKSSVEKGVSFIRLLFGCFFLGLFLTSSYFNLNYVLDFKEPQEVVVKIEDKVIRSSGRRSGRTYNFFFYVDGKSYEMRVSYTEYNKYDEGDDYVLAFHEGAFETPFFISGKYND